MINEVLSGVAHGIFAGFTGKTQPTLEDGNKSTVTSLASQHGHGIGDAIRVIYQKIVEDNKKEQDLTPKQTEDTIVSALNKVNEHHVKRTEANDNAKRSHEEALLKEIADNTKAIAANNSINEQANGTKELIKEIVKETSENNKTEVSPDKTTKELIKEIVKETSENNKTEVSPDKTTKELIKEIVKETSENNKTEVSPDKTTKELIKETSENNKTEVSPDKTTKELIKEIVKETIVGKTANELSKGGMLGRFAADVITKAVLEKTSVASALGSTIKSRAESGGAIGKILSVVHDAYKEQAAKIDSAQVPKSEVTAEQKSVTEAGVTEKPEVTTEKKSVTKSEVVAEQKSTPENVTKDVQSETIAKPEVTAKQKSTPENVTKDVQSETIAKPEVVKQAKNIPLVTSSGLTIAPHKKTKLAMELMAALASQPRNRLSTIPMANTRSPILAAAKNISGIEQPTTQQEQQVTPQQEKDSGGGLLSTLANAASIAMVLPKVGAMLPGLAAAGTTALAAGGVAAAGAAGYGLGTLIQPGLDKAFGGESGSIGSRIYDWLNPSTDSNIAAPVPARAVPPQIVENNAAPSITANPTSIQSEINTAMDVSDALTASKAAQQSQPVVIQQPANSTQQESGGVNKIVSIRNADSSFERVQMNDYWPTRIA
jgi:hypothetical protein